jgi:hypothetical protein
MPAYIVSEVAFDKISGSRATVLTCRSESGDIITLKMDYRLLVPLASEVACAILAELGEGPALPALQKTPGRRPRID